MCETCGCHQADSLYMPEVCTIVKTSKFTDKDSFFEFKFADKDLGHKPGQFVGVSIPGIGESPISISSSPTKKGSFEMVIRKIGKVTTAIHQLKTGDTVGIRGPFGTHFPIEDYKGEDLLFIGGGIGLVPMRSAINYALDNRKDYGAIILESSRYRGERCPIKAKNLNLVGAIGRGSPSDCKVVAIRVPCD